VRPGPRRFEGGAGLLGRVTSGRKELKGGRRFGPVKRREGLGLWEEAARWGGSNPHLQKIGCCIVDEDGSGRVRFIWLPEGPATGRRPTRRGWHRSARGVSRAEAEACQGRSDWRKWRGGGCRCGSPECAWDGCVRKNLGTMIRDAASRSGVR